MLREELIQVSSEYSIEQLTVQSEEVVEKQISSGRYYFVVKSKDLNCTEKWAGCKEFNITEDYMDVEIPLNEMENPESCDGTCNEGICE